MGCHRNQESWENVIEYIIVSGDTFPDNKVHGANMGPTWVLSAPDDIIVSGDTFPDSKVHGANMGPTWVLSAPDGPHVVPINFVIRVGPNRHQFEYENYILPE